MKRGRGALIALLASMKALPKRKGNLPPPTLKVRSVTPQ